MANQVKPSITELSDKLVSIAKTGDKLGTLTEEFKEMARSLATPRSKKLTREQTFVLGEAVARHFKTEVKLTKLGRVDFKRDVGRGMAAQSMWRETGALYDPAPKDTRGGAKSKKADPVGKLMATIEKMIEEGKLNRAEVRRLKSEINAL